MEKIDLIGLEEHIYKEILPSGMTIYLLPLKNKINYSMHYVTKYGSNDTMFVPLGEEKEIKVNDGTAHFLEHKKFETENGIDPFSFASKSGTDCNAATYYNYTRYLFEGNRSFKENLDYLLTLVHTPYFTKENVEKEKGIIIEELLQYQDMIEYRMDNIIKQNCFHNHPVRIDIGGTVESVKSITKEELDIIYKTFYQPSNMFLVITGNFDIQDVLDVVNNNQTLNNVETGFEIKRHKYEEPLSVVKKSEEILYTTNTPKMVYAIKVHLSREDQFLTSIYLSMMLSILFGSSSAFREKMKEKKLYTSFYTSKEKVDDFILLTLVSETPNPDELIKNIEEELQNMSLQKEDFDRMKKVWLANEVMLLDDINACLDSIVYDVLEYGDVINNRIPLFKNLDYSKFLESINSMDFSNTSYVIVRPKQ